jgi:hypothetical protein
MQTVKDVGDQSHTTTQENQIKSGLLLYSKDAQSCSDTRLKAVMQEKLVQPVSSSELHDHFSHAGEENGCRGVSGPVFWT